MWIQKLSIMRRHKYILDIFGWTNYEWTFPWPFLEDKLVFVFEENSTTRTTLHGLHHQTEQTSNQVVG